MAIKKIRQRQEDIHETLGAGNIKSVEDYRFHIGELTALRTMESEIRDATEEGLTMTELAVPNHIAEEEEKKKKKQQDRM